MFLALSHAAPDVVTCCSFLEDTEAIVFTAGRFSVVGSRICVDHCCVANCMSGLQGATNFSF